VWAQGLLPLEQRQAQGRPRPSTVLEVPWLQPEETGALGPAEHPCMGADGDGRGAKPASILCLGLKATKILSSFPG